MNNLFAERRILAVATLLCLRALMDRMTALVEADDLLIKSRIGFSVGAIGDCISLLDSRWHELCETSVMSIEPQMTSFILYDDHVPHYDCTSNVDLYAKLSMLIDRLPQSLGKSERTRTVLAVARCALSPHSVIKNNYKNDDFSILYRLFSNDTLRSAPSSHRHQDLCKELLPGRPEFLRYRSSPSESYRSRLATPDGRAAIMFGMYLDIEIAACEVCALTSLLDPNMPVEFHADMARQIGDEARHADAILAHYKSCGFSMGDHVEYTGHVWRKWKLAANTSERLAIQQVLQEGNALDSVGLVAADFSLSGDSAMGEILIDIEQDEALHAGFGVKWLAYLGYGSEHDLLTIVDDMAGRVGTSIPGFAPVNFDLRHLAGFHEGTIHTLHDRQVANAAGT